MIVRFSCGSAVLLFAATMLGGCEILGGDDSSGPAIDYRTTENRYEPLVIEAALPHIGFDIVTTLSNNGDEEIVVTGCMVPNRPVLQKKVDDSWFRIYSVAEPECFSPPWVIQPGESRTDTFRVETPLRLGVSDQKFKWPNTVDRDVNINGEYRLERLIYHDADQMELLPLNDRISNTFEIIAVPNPISF